MPVASDESLGQIVGLDEEEVLPYGGRSLLVNCLVDRLRGDDVQYRQVGHRVG